MKKSIKRILACILCVICLASSFLVFMLEPSAAQRIDTGYFEYATITYTASLYYYEDNSYDEDVTNQTYVSAVDLLIQDNITALTFCKVGFESLARTLYQYSEDGYYAPSVSVSVNFSQREFPLDDFCLYSTSPTSFFVGTSPYGDQPNFIDDFTIAVSSPSYSYLPLSAYWNNGRWLPNLSGNISYGNEENTVSGFSFTIYPNYLLDREFWLSDIASKLGFSADGQPIDSPLALRFWGYPGFYYDVSDIDAARQDGYDRGYENGYHDAHFASQETARTEGFNAGYLLGYEESEIDNQPVWYRSGYDDGERDGLDAGFDNGYDVGYLDGCQTGYNDGFQAGHTTDLDLSMGGLFTEIIGAPVKVVLSTLHFDFLGVNLSATFRGLITLAILIALTTVVIKVFL